MFSHKKNKFARNQSIFFWNKILVPPFGKHRSQQPLSSLLPLTTPLQLLPCYATEPNKLPGCHLSMSKSIYSFHAIYSFYSTVSATGYALKTEISFSRDYTSQYMDIMITS